MADKGSCTSDSALGDYIYDFNPLGFKDFANNVNKKVEIQDPLEEVDVGVDNVKHLTYISRNLPEKFKG